MRTNWNPWPVSIIGFFALALLGCVAFIVFCSRHPADLVAADYYEQELRYQSRIDDQRRALEPAQGASVSYDASSRQIRIALPAGTASAKAAGSIQLYRPSAMNLDRRIELEPDARGNQAIDARALLPGLWKVRVSWTISGREFFTDQPIVVGSAS